MYQVVIADDNIARQDFDAAMLERRGGRLREKRNCLPSSSHGEGIHVWRAQVEALHPQSVHANLGDLKLKICSRRGKYFNVGGLDPALQWISKSDNSIPRHFCLPRAETAMLNISMRTNLISGYFSEGI
jgi:hypothetical protein